MAVSAGAVNGDERMTSSGAAATRIDPERPLHELWSRYRRHRPRLVGAIVASIVNKVADVVPELLIGAAVDVVIRGQNSWAADVLGVEYLIWQGQIWSLARDAEGWRPYNGGGMHDPASITGGHYDHLHVTVKAG